MATIFNNLKINHIRVGKGLGLFAHIYLLSSSDNGTLYRQIIDDGRIEWSNNDELSSIIAIDGNAYSNSSYVAFTNNKVKKIDAQGNESWSYTALDQPTNLSLASNGTLQVTLSNNTLISIDADTGEKVASKVINNPTALHSKYGIVVGTSTGAVTMFDSSLVPLWENTHGSTIIELITDPSGNTFSLSSNDTLRKINVNGDSSWTVAVNTYGSAKSLAYDPFDKVCYIGTSNGYVVTVDEFGQELSNREVSTGVIEALSFWYDYLYVADSLGEVLRLTKSLETNWNRIVGSKKTDLHITKAQVSVHPTVRAKGFADIDYSLDVAPTMYRDGSYESGLTYVSHVSEYSNSLYRVTPSSDTTLSVNIAPVMYRDGSYESDMTYVSNTSNYQSTEYEVTVNNDTTLSVNIAPTMHKSGSYESDMTYVSNTSNYQSTEYEVTVNSDTTLSVNIAPTMHKSGSYESELTYITN